MSAVRTPPRVLLVQQTTDDVEMYVEFFSAHRFTIIVVSTTEAALRAAGEADIIVTEIQINNAESGIDLITRLRQDAHTRDIPMIVLTADAWVTDRQRAEAAGCDLFLTKPCLPNELLRHARLLLSRRR
jgi:two-component system, cell cycle response regulator DivK